MTNWQKPQALFSQPSRLEGWLRRLLFSPAGQEWETAPVAQSVFNDTAASGGFHWLNRAGPLSGDELRVLSFLMVGM